MEDDVYRASPHWKRLYEDAVLELDPIKAQERLKEAQVGIMHCIEELKRSGDIAKAEPLWHALNTVLDLRRVVERESREP